MHDEGTVLALLVADVLDRLIMLDLGHLGLGVAPSVKIVHAGVGRTLSLTRVAGVQHLAVLLLVDERWAGVLLSLCEQLLLVRTWYH